MKFFLNFFKALGIIKNVSLALGKQNLLTFPYPIHCSRIFIFFIHVFSLILFLYNIYVDLNFLHKNSHNLFHLLGILKNSISVNCSEFDLTGYIFLKFHLIEK